MEEMNKKPQDVVNNASRGQNIAQEEGNNVPSPGKKESVGTQDEPLTTEKFQQLLADNTSLQNTARNNYAEQLAGIDKKFNDKLDKLTQEEIAAERRYRDAKVACEMAAQDYMLARRSIARDRNEAGQEKNKARAELKGKYAIYNETLQSLRHRIFERYRNSGGVLTGQEEELLHPDWIRGKKGGMSDEEK